ncbi:MAG: tRNA pseudouridine(55) synthase TruB [Deltaproteobacteria bacterium]|nr:tRNA pseudouridine(55) synthase TruB [Deltaproteobacteria bacterium]
MTRRSGCGLDGVLLIDKPAGLTSAGVVREVKRRLGGPKVGHLGTLDPFATGLLPLALGEASKIVPFLNQEGKAYSGTIVLGRETDTLDATGETTASAPVPVLDDARLATVAADFLGEIEQVPPMFSALKRGGTPLYALARRGVSLALEARKVRIEALSLAAAGAQSLAISVRCSKGTYVRSLARDIARALGTVGHLGMLRRTAFGPFEVAQAVPLEAVGDAADLCLLSPRAALVGLRELRAEDRLVAEVRRGQQSGFVSLPAPRGPGEIAKLLDGPGNLVAIVAASGRSWRLLRVLAPTRR